LHGKLCPERSIGAGRKHDFAKDVAQDRSRLFGSDKVIAQTSINLISIERGRPGQHRQHSCLLPRSAPINI
jgi:hypothetical protein